VRVDWPEFDAINWEAYVKGNDFKVWKLDWSKDPQSLRKTVRNEK